MSMPLPRRYTADDVRALPDDGKRYETVRGELLVTPAPGGFHQPMLMRLVGILQPYLMAAGLEQLLTSPADISFDDDTLVQPDIFVADCTDFFRSDDWADIRTLYLVIEIISKSSVKADRVTKRRLFQEQRIPEYWVVDVEQQQVEVWTPDALFPAVVRERMSWRHPLLNVDCTLDLTRLFARP
jgi:Uma2 family endonuclease